MTDPFLKIVVSFIIILKIEINSNSKDNDAVIILPCLDSNVSGIPGIDNNKKKTRVFVQLTDQLSIIRVQQSNMVQNSRKVIQLVVV